MKKVKKNIYIYIYTSNPSVAKKKKSSGPYGEGPYLGSPRFLPSMEPPRGFIPLGEWRVGRSMDSLRKKNNLEGLNLLQNYSNQAIMLAAQRLTYR
jgi:hypothetical protein